MAEVGPNYTLLRSKETKAKRRKRQREDARAALDGHTVLSTGSRLEIFCDSERWYPATVMAREEDGDGRIVHEVEYDGYSDRRWWHMLDDERWRAVPEQAGAGAGGAAADGDGDAAMDRADGERGARAAGDAEAASIEILAWLEDLRDVFVVPDFASGGRVLAPDPSRGGVLVPGRLLPGRVARA